MKTQTHIIRRQVLEVDVPSVERAWEVQNRISELFRQEFIPALEKIFDSICDPGKMIRIDKLEIDLGNVSIEKLEEQLREKLEEYLIDSFIPVILNKIG